MFEGKLIHLGDQDWTIPPLSLKQVKALKHDIECLDTADFGAESLDIVIKLVHAALSRNYPSVSIAQLEEWLDLGNVQELVQVILGQSGFSKGEGRAEVTLTGTTSLPSSLQ